MRLKAPLPYRTADNFALFPENSEEVVVALAQRLKLQDKLDLHFHFELRGDTPPKRVKLPFAGGITLRAALTKFCDVRGPLRPKMLKDLAGLAGAAAEREELTELAALALKKGAPSDNEFAKLQRERASLLSVLEHFKSVELSVEQLFELAPRIMVGERDPQPRYYTIASSNLVSPESLEIAISLTKERLPNTEPWLGLASGFLSRLGKGPRTVRGFTKASAFRLPGEVQECAPAPPVIMVGPGTGVAPFRAFLQEIEARKLRGAFPYSLYFGCRRRDSDYIFKEELEAHFAEKEGLVVAFSREGAEKVYVQHLVEERMASIAEAVLAKGGYVYLCG